MLTIVQEFYIQVQTKHLIENDTNLAKKRHIFIQKYLESFSQTVTPPLTFQNTTSQHVTTHQSDLQASGIKF